MTGPTAMSPSSRIVEPPAPDREKPGVRGLRWSLIAVFGVATVFPLLWMLSTSLKTQGNLSRLPPQWIPNPVTLEHYDSVLTEEMPFFTLLWNSTVVAVGVSLLATILGSLAAYGFSRYLTAGGNQALLVLLLAGQMFPGVMLAIPSFILLRDLGLLDTRLALILANTSLALPFTIYLLKGFFDTLPPNMEHAAMVDGCTRFQAFYKVAVPLTVPGIVATAFMAFVIAWDEYVLALTLITSAEKRTLPVGIVNAFVGELSVKWGDMMAASFLVSLPVVLVFLFVQRQLIEGLTAGAIKG